MKRTLVALVLPLAFVAGCGGDSEESSSAPSFTPIDSRTIKPAGDQMKLVDACPLVEQALPGGTLPEASEWVAAASTLRSLRTIADVEAQNALDLLIPAVEVMASDPAPGQEFLDAEGGLLAGLDGLANRCKAVGSSALQ